ncbi:MAG TPA: hypothetical protein PKB10_07565 [Tepidisphaeraceae bacterium]|nr:hypothetical protein [Tepidisphaeraceae bacterium]
MLKRTLLLIGLLAGSGPASGQGVSELRSSDPDLPTARQTPDELLTRRVPRPPTDVPPDAATVRAEFERSLRTSIPKREPLPDWRPRPSSRAEQERSRINRTFHPPTFDPCYLPRRFWWCW